MGAQALLLSFERRLVLSDSHSQLGLRRVLPQRRAYTELSRFLPSTELNQVLQRQFNVSCLKIAEHLDHIPLLPNSEPVVL